MPKSLASQLSHQRWYARNRARENEKQRRRYHQKKGRPNAPPKRKYAQSAPYVAATVNVQRAHTVVSFD